MDVPKEKKESLSKELEALTEQGKEITERLTNLGVSFDEQLGFNGKYFG